MPTATHRLSTVSPNWERLGTLVTAERARRRRSLRAFAESVGLSKGTLDNIEHGRKTSYDPTTLAALEHGMGWQPGSIERVLSGLNPLPDADPDLTAVIDAWSQLSPGTRRMLRILAVEAARAEG